MRVDRDVQRRGADPSARSVEGSRNATTRPDTAPAPPAKALEAADRRRRGLLTAVTAALGTAFAVVAASPFVASLAPSERARVAGGPVEADVSDLSSGEMKIVVWRGQPVWLLHRSPVMLASLSGHNAQLVDPMSRVDQQPPYCQNETRSIQPRLFVAVGLCTHLGCSPHLQKMGDQPQPTEFFCPCHGSIFDLAGRVYREVPAPRNLLVPRHRYLSDTRILVGDDKRNS